MKKRFGIILLLYLGIFCLLLSVLPEENLVINKHNNSTEKTFSRNVSRNNDWVIDKIDWAPPVGQFTSISLDSKNNPHVSYSSSEKGDDDTMLKYVFWNMTEWEIEYVDWSANVGRSSTIAIDENDLPHISYLDAANSDVKYAHWNGSDWKKETVSTSPVGGGFFNSLALDSDNLPHICYSTDSIKYAKWDGDDWNIETIEPRTSLGYSLALDSDDFAHISYCDYHSEELIYAKWTGLTWNISTIDSEGEIAGYTSLAVDSYDNPHICYYDLSNGDIIYTKWNGASWNKLTVDSCGVGDEISLALDDDDNPHISYYDGTNKDLKFAEWTGTEWTYQTVDSTGDVGEDSSLVLDPYGDPHISYYDATNKDLKYAEIDNTPPTVVDIVVKNELINEDNLILELEIIFNEGMDIAFNPTIELKGLLTPITNSGTGDWVDPYIYKVTAKIKDDNEEYTSLSVDIDGGYDVFGNEMEINTIIVPLVIDTKPPFIVDHSSSNATTGDMYNFNIEISDGFGVASADVIWTQGSQYGNISMQYDGNSMWIASIEIPHNFDEFKYRFYTNDTSGNIYLSPFRYVNIIDNDPPFNASVKGDFEAGTGEDFIIWARASDNIKVVQAALYIREVDGTWSAVEMTESNNFSIEFNHFEISYSEIITSTSLDSLNGTSMEYYILLSDGAGLNYSTNQHTINYVDILPPTIHNVQPGNREVIAGEVIEIEVSGWDNVDNIIEGWIIYNDLSNETHNITLTNFKATIETGKLNTGEISYRIYLMDKSGNLRESFQYIITIIINDRDNDGVEDSKDIFPDDPDEYNDTDEDGVGDNSDAFPNDPSASLDSDGDGFPDEWNKGMNGSHSTLGLKLDKFPDNSNEWEDTDSDGIGNNEDTDDDNDGIPDIKDQNPLTKDITDEKTYKNESKLWIFILIGLFILIVIVVIIILIKRRKPRNPNEQNQSFERTQDHNSEMYWEDHYNNTYIDSDDENNW